MVHPASLNQTASEWYLEKALDFSSLTPVKLHSDGFYRRTAIESIRLTRYRILSQELPCQRQITLRTTHTAIDRL